MGPPRGWLNLRPCPAEHPVLRPMPAGAAELGEQLQTAVTEMAAWMGEYGDAATHPAQEISLAELETATAELRQPAAGQLPVPPPALRGADAEAAAPGRGDRLRDGDAGQPQQPRARRRAGDGRDGEGRRGPAGRDVRLLATHLGHLTSSGTIANLEALFVARETHPGKAIAHSADAHYTHARMAHLLGIEAVAVPTAADGTMDLDALDRLLAGGRVGTVVATDRHHRAGRRRPGARDRADRAPPRRAGARRRGVRRLLPADRRRRARTGSPRRRTSPSPTATRSSSTRTSTACSPTGAARCCSATRPSRGTTCTTRPTPTSPPTSSTSARSRSSARGPARPRPRCGSRSGCCR